MERSVARSLGGCAILAAGLALSACASGSAVDQDLRVLRDDVAALRASVERITAERERGITALDQTIERQAREAGARDDAIAAALADVTRRVGALSHHAEGEADRTADQRRFVTESVDALAARLSPLADSLAALDGRLTALDGRLTALDARVGSLDERLAALPAATPPAPSGDNGTPAIAAAPGIPGPETATPEATVSVPATALPMSPPPPPSVAPPPAAPPGAMAPPATAPSTARPVERPGQSSVRPQDIYDAAYIDFGRGSYALAIGGFGEFLRRFPDDPLAANAQYWIGEAHLGLARSLDKSSNAERASEERRQAVEALARVVERYPHSDKAPLALYREAVILSEQGEDDKARERLQRLIATFPAAAETRLAREQLSRGRE
jgi:tol-pal system protein YbgF